MMIAKTVKSAAIAVTLATSLAGWSNGTGKPVSLVDKIKERRTLNRSGSQGTPGFSRPDKKGVWRGFGSEISRAIAAVILGDFEKAKFVALNAAQHLPALQTGEIGVPSRISTLTFYRDMAIPFVANILHGRDVVLAREADSIDAHCANPIVLKTTSYGYRDFAASDGLK